MILLGLSFKSLIKERSDKLDYNKTLELAEVFAGYTNYYLSCKVEVSNEGSEAVVTVSNTSGEDLEEFNNLVINLCNKFSNNRIIKESNKVQIHCVDRDASKEVVDVARNYILSRAVLSGICSSSEKIGLVEGIQDMVKISPYEYTKKFGYGVHLKLSIDKNTDLVHFKVAGFTPSTEYKYNELLQRIDEFENIYKDPNLKIDLGYVSIEGSFSSRKISHRFISHLNMDLISCLGESTETEEKDDNISDIKGLRLFEYDSAFINVSVEELNSSIIYTLISSEGCVMGFLEQISKFNISDEYVMTSQYNNEQIKCVIELIDIVDASTKIQLSKEVHKFLMNIINY